MTYESQSPPTKASLKAWWHNFKSAQRVRKDDDGTKGDEEHPVFGRPLRDTVKYASVQISTAPLEGPMYVWGYVPIVVAKCGLYLKENATEVEGTFRVNGSNKRMRDLQACFEQPPWYGKNLDWKKETYTTHDVASVFRRYLTQMPEPVIPHDMYHDFRDALAKIPYDHDKVMATYTKLIGAMPRANQYLLLYVLDLLSVFARKSDKNLMTATNLAVIFRPGLISHPNHELSPQEHQLSQKVLEFLIEHQDWFMWNMPPPPDAPPGFRRPTSRTGSGEDDLVIVPSSHEEEMPSVGSWKSVKKDKQLVKRRRTTVDHSEAGKRLPPVAKELSPINESGSGVVLGPVGVTRSRTLPSRRDAAAAAAVEPGISSEDEKRPLRVLRKKERTSAQPRRSGGHLTSEPTVAATTV